MLIEFLIWGDFEGFWTTTPEKSRKAHFQSSLFPFPKPDFSGFIWDFASYVDDNYVFICVDHDEKCDSHQKEDEGYSVSAGHEFSQSKCIIQLSLHRLFTVRSDLCGQPFELKITDTRFVGYPLQVTRSEPATNVASHHETPYILFFCVIFVLKVNAMKISQHCKRVHRLPQANPW